MVAENRVTPAGPGWFMVAAHALVVLARSDGFCCSQTIAGNLQAHAVFMRRILAQLARAGIVEAREGRDGGYRLARPAGSITLGEVYRAVAAPAAIPLSASMATECAAMSEVRAAFDAIAVEAEAALVGVLDRHTISELLTSDLAIGVSA